MRYVLVCITHDGQKVYCSSVGKALCQYSQTTDTEFYADPFKAIRFEYDPKEYAEKLAAKKPAYSRAKYFTEKAPGFEDGQVVGYINLTEERVVERTYECAAWYTRIQLKPGRYEVKAHLNNNEWWFGTSIPGTVVSDYFQSLFCGNAIGERYDTSQNKGKADEWAVSWRPFYGYERDAVPKAWNFEATNMKLKEVI